jgi:hypothetical protein
MAAAGFPWTDLQPSRERANWLRAAAGVSLVLAAGFMVRALADSTVASTWPLLVAALVCAAAAALAFRAARARGPAACLAIDPEGVLWARAGTAAVGHDTRPVVQMRPQVVSDRLVTLSGSGQRVVVWCDALPPQHFRRLSAHARWHVERTGTDFKRPN